MNIAKCRTCERPIIWTRTVNGKWMPVDAEPVENGNLILLVPVDGTPQSLVSKEGANVGFLHYRSHFVSCPQASEHRRKKT